MFRGSAGPGLPIIDYRGQVANHQINQLTGFIENPGFEDDFDSERKQAFLEIYKANGMRFKRSCDELHLHRDTVSKHYETDPAFRKAMDDCEKTYIDELQAFSRDNALNNKNATIERIFHLKVLNPSKYGQSQKPNKTEITLNFSGNGLKDFVDQGKVIETDAEQTEIAQITTHLPTSTVDTTTANKADSND